MKRLCALAIILSTLAGCRTTSSKNETAEAGPDGTIVYEVPVETSEPDARIEINGESVGETPLVLKVFGDKDGTFHSFGSYDFVVRAYPPGVGRPSMTKVYKTGALFAAEDKIPPRIYFDFGPKSSSAATP